MRKQIQLADGSSCVIRALTVMDSLRSVGFIMEPGGDPEKAVAVSGQAQKTGIDAKELRIGMLLTRHILLNCVSPISKGPERIKIVEKDLDQLGRGEMHIDEVEPEIARDIVNEVLRLGREAGAEAGKFPEEPATTAADRSTGETLRSAANGSIPTAP